MIWWIAVLCVLALFPTWHFFMRWYRLDRPDGFTERGEKDSSSSYPE
jgi:hypothetical protein